MKIRITKDDILTGQSRDQYRCPLALALIRDDKWVVIVHPGAVVFESVAGHEVYWRLPEELCDFVKRVDNGLPVEPMEFDLPVFVP